MANKLPNRFGTFKEVIDNANAMPDAKDVTDVVEGSDVSISSFGVSEGSINDPELYEKATSAAHSKGVALKIDGVYDFGGGTATQTAPCVVYGSGTILDLNINLDLTQDDEDSPKFIGVTYKSSDRTHSINLVSVRLLEVAGVKTYNVDYPFTSSSTDFHAVGLINFHDNVFYAAKSPIKLLTASPTNRPYNDFRITNNISWFCKESGMIEAEQLDGMTYANNLTHFDNDVSTAKCHIDITKGEHIVIGAGNTYFNGGEEAIVLTDTTSAQIGGVNRFWHNGQNVTSSCIKVENDSSHFLNLTIDGGLHFEKPSQHMINIQAENGLVRVGDVSGTIDVNIAYNATTNPTGFYFGTDDLATIDHYGIYSPLGCEVIADPKSLKFINATSKLLDIENDFPTFESQTFHGHRNVSGVTKATKSISTNAATTLVRVFNSEQSNGDGSGEVLVTAYGPTGKSAVYKLLVSVDDSGASITTLGSAGKTSGAAADEPSFTFGVYAGGDIHITRVAATPSGDFDFIIHARGDMYPRNLS